MAEAGVESGRDDPHVDRVVTARDGDDGVVELVPLDCLVRDHEDPKSGALSGVDVHGILLCSVGDVPTMEEPPAAALRLP